MHTTAHMCCRKSQMFLHIASPLEIHWETNTQAHFILHTHTHTHILFVNSLFSGKCVTSQLVALARHSTFYAA